MTYRRFVALGDSTTEGLMDPLPDGSGFRGWADRLAEMLAVLDPELRYANLAVRGKLARQVRAEQLDVALALQPDLVSVLSGLNDMLRKNVDVDAVVGEIDAMVAALREAGADVLLFTLPDPVPINPLAKSAAVRLRHLNAAIREIATRRGAFLVSSTRTPSPPTGGCGTRTGCTRTRRATAGSRRGGARARPAEAPTRRGPTSSPTRSAAARAPRTRSGSGATSRRG